MIKQKIIVEFSASAIVGAITDLFERGWLVHTMTVNSSSGAYVVVLQKES